MFKRAEHREIGVDDFNRDFPIRAEDYGDEGIEASLVRLYKVADSHADWRIKWYDRKADSARSMSRLLRGASLICFALGTIAPIASNILSSIAEVVAVHLTNSSGLPEAMDRVSVSDVGYIFLAVAGGLVVFDQFFEYSASWTRFRQSQARLERLRADLRYTWAVRMAEAMHPRRTAICGGGVTTVTVEASAAVPAPEIARADVGTTPPPPTAKSGEGSAAPSAMNDCAVVQLIQILRDFVNSIELLAETETREWAERYRARIQAFDDQALRNGGVTGGGPSKSTASVGVSANVTVGQTNQTKESPSKE